MWGPGKSETDQSDPTAVLRTEGQGMWAGQVAIFSMAVMLEPLHAGQADTLQCIAMQ